MLKLVGVILALVILVAPLAVEAQQTGKVYRIGELRGGPPSGSTTLSFRQGLRDLGYVEGQNLMIETRAAEGRRDRLPGLAAELVRLNVDAIVTSGPDAIRAVQRATRTIPIIAAVMHEPMAFGFVESFARPGRNITGLAFQDSDLSTKRLELLTETLPGLSRASPYFSAHQRKITDLALQYRIPTICEQRPFVEVGCLMSYGPNFDDMFRRAAAFVDKVLKGAKPSDLPVEQPTKFELVINRKTAKALGLTIPQSLLLRADQVIQ